MAAGTILTSSLNSAGTGYFATQLVFVDPSATLSQAQIVIDTVSGLGAVLTYTMTDGADGYSVASNVRTNVQPGDPGAGFTIDILTVEGGGGSGYGNSVY